MTAVITEAQRFEMHTCLRGLMGEEVANTMMEHLPPSAGPMSRVNPILR
jgi:hypothetical protein